MYSLLLCLALAIPSDGTAHLEQAVLELADERDALREENTRLREMLDGCEADLQIAMRLTETTLTLRSMIADQHQADLKRLRWRSRWQRLGCTAGVGVAGSDEFTGPWAVACGFQFWRPSK